MIVSGRKTLELRPTATHKINEIIGIIQKGSGTIIGVVRIAGCRGPLDRAELDALRPRHLASAEELDAHPAWRFAWELSGAIAFPEPIPYRHPAGAQSFVTLSDAEALAVQMAMAPPQVRGIVGRSQAGRDALKRGGQ